MTPPLSQLPERGNPSMRFIMTRSDGSPQANGFATSHCNVRPEATGCSLRANGLFAPDRLFDVPYVQIEPLCRFNSGRAAGRTSQPRPQLGANNPLARGEQSVRSGRTIRWLGANNPTPGLRKTRGLAGASGAAERASSRARARARRAACERALGYGTHSV